MIVYEVNITIAPEIYTDFLAWLKPHIQEMLTLPGFQNARLFQEQDQHSPSKLVVQYYVKDQSAMEHYIRELAPHMRAEGLEKFATAFQIDRRILTEMS